MTQVIRPASYPILQNNADGVSAGSVLFRLTAVRESDCGAAAFRDAESPVPTLTAVAPLAGNQTGDGFVGGF